MDEKELLENLDGMDIPQNAKDKVRKMLKKKQEKREQGMDRKELAKMIAKELKEILPDGKKLLDAIKKIEVKAPEVNIPEIKVPEVKIPAFRLPDIHIPKIETPKIPDIKLPEIKIPEIKVPEIKIPEQKIIMPSEMEVKGIGSYFKGVNDSIKSIIKNKFNVVLHGGINNTGSVERDNPVPVVLVDEKGDYKKLGSGNNGVRSGGDLVAYLSPIKDKIVQLLFHHGHLKVLGYWESVGHNTTNTTITKERASGRKTGIGTGAFSIIETYPFVQPGGDTQMYIQSTSPQDGVAGTGVQEITIEYFEDAWGDMKTETVVMNGTTQVTFSFSNVYRIHSIKATKIGTSQNAEGNITITDLATTTLYGQIDQYNNYMERCIFYVANGKQVTCTEISIGSVTSGGVEIRLVASEEDSAGNIVPRARIPFEIVSGGQYIKFKIDETVVNPNNKRIALLLVVRATSTASNQKATGAMKGVTESITES